MRLVCISDTHGHTPTLPAGDVLVHAGDLTGRGTPSETAAAFRWLSQQPFAHIVAIAGNHDFLAERDPALFRSLIPPNVTYLQDSGTTIGGLRFWGSPVTPRFFDWAFNRDADIARHWAMIPPDTDVLVVHGPPRGTLDQTVRGQAVGCPALRDRLEALNPRLVVFGHIHEAQGMVVADSGTVYANAALLDEKYRPVFRPQIIDLE